MSKRKRELEKLLPLDAAAKRLGIDENVLTALIENGTINANDHEGEILVPESEVKQVITLEQFKKLKGKPITMSEASRKYGPTIKAIWTWVERGYIPKLDDAYPVHLDEQHVAYRCAIYKSLDGRPGKRIFDKAGRPYRLKRPELADYRKRKAEQEQRARV